MNWNNEHDENKWKLYNKCKLQKYYKKMTENWWQWHTEMVRYSHEIDTNKRVWAQMCAAINACGHIRMWAHTCVGAIVSGHNRVGPNTYGHKRGETDRQWHIKPGSGEVLLVYQQAEKIFELIICTIIFVTDKGRRKNLKIKPLLLGKAATFIHSYMKFIIMENIESSWNILIVINLIFFFLSKYFH